MENASKALIIAGAILLSILLISLGIMIFGQAQDTVNNSGMSQAEIQAFNNKFVKYESTGGTKGSVVKTLVNEVIASNADTSLPKIEVTLGGATIVKHDATNPVATTSGISIKETYSVTLGYTNGYVSTITIAVAP